MTWAMCIECAWQRLVILGAACSDRHCTEVAAAMCYWPGQPGAKCAKHAAAWTVVAAAMGFVLQTRPLDVRATGDDATQRFALMELA